MSDTKKKSRPFLRGLAVLLPSVLTLWLLVKAYQFIDLAIAEPINRGIRLAFVELTFAIKYFDSTKEVIQNNVDMWWAAHPYMNLLGLIVAAIIVYICGRLVGGFLGRTLYRTIENLMSSIPIISKIYPYVKQLVDFLIADSDKPKFSRVVAVEYPRKGIWAVGFLTGESMNSLKSKMPDSVTVFIPSSPTPFTGYTITIPKSEIIDLPITVEEAIRFAVSGGVLKPENQMLNSKKVAQDSDESGNQTSKTAKSKDST